MNKIFFNKSALITLLFLFLYLPWGIAQNNGRLRTMVVLPEKDTTVTNPDMTIPAGELYMFGLRDTKQDKQVRERVTYIRFSLGSVPKGARIDAVALKVWLKDVGAATSEQFVRVYELNGTGNWNSMTWGTQPVPNADVKNLKAISSAKVTIDDTGKAVMLPMEIADKEKWLVSKNGNLWYILAANSQQYTYYSSRAADLSRGPRLVITYHMPDELQYSSWSQYKHDAQHTASSTWKSNAEPTSFDVKAVFTAQGKGTNYISSDPVFTNNMLIFYGQTSGNFPNRIRAYSGGGTLIAEDSSIGSLVKFNLIADRNHNVYCVMTNKGNSVKVLRADSNLKTAYNVTLQGDVNVTPVVGFDGSLYFSTNNGIFAYTAFPQFKIKWRYGMTNCKFGSVALSEDEKIVYVYNGDKRMVALDNEQGRVLWESPGFPEFTTDIPVPSVKGNKVFVIDGFRKGRNFYTADAPDLSGPKKTITMTKLVADKTVSQPVVGDDRIFVINSSVLQSYKYPDMTVTNYNVQGLNEASTIVADENQNVYVLCTELGQQKLTTVLANGQVFNCAVKAEMGSLIGNSLFISPEGRLFTRSDNGLYVFYPTSFTEKGNISIPGGNEFNDEFVYRSEGKITVEGKAISNTRNVVIHSLSGISFRNGFSVKKGAQLSVLAGK